MRGIDGILAGYERLRAGQEAFYKDLHQAGLPGCACGVSWLARWRYPAGRSASLRSFRPSAASDSVCPVTCLRHPHP